MTVRFRPEARREVHEASAWYEERATGLGLEFVRVLEVAVLRADRTPLAFHEVEQGCRRVFMRRFPYSVIYLPEPNGILVVAVFHHRRDPEAWTGRLGS